MCCCSHSQAADSRLYFISLNKAFLLSLVEGLSLLGAYEDSDEEDARDSHRSAANSQHNQSGDIDSTLANFMAVSMMRIL